MEPLVALYKRNSRWLGMFPAGAFDECADAGRLLAAVLSGQVVGYVAYRVAGEEAAITHLCVDEAHRGAGIARGLLGEVFRETTHLAAVRASCRRDYPANAIWPRFGFRYVDERPGRGHDHATLMVWRRANRDEDPLYAALREAQRRSRRTVVVDANVFYDFDSDEERAAESKSLLADWLQDEVLVCVSGELSNEIARNDDPDDRALRLGQARRYYLLEARPDELQHSCARVCEVLPPPSSPADESDRRQLAHSLAGGAEFFVTRDDALLAQATAIERALGLRVMRPSDLIRVIHGDLDPVAYSPARLLGTRVQERMANVEADLSSFQAFGQAESRATFLGRARPALTDPARFSTRLFAPPGEAPILLCSTEQDLGVGELRIVLLRMRRHALSATLLRRVVSELVYEGQQRGLRRIRCDDALDPVIVGTLGELGFRATPAGHVKTLLRGLVERASLPALDPALANAAELHDRDVERQFWPLKVADADLPSFVIPIQPRWAAELFDAELAAGTLFGTQDDALALALENVYYSAAPLQIPPGGRILWYVSKEVKALRACSLCVETVRVPARDAFRRFQRLGVYDWSDVLQRADGDPAGEVTAYRFAFTERFSTPVPRKRLQQILIARHGHGNPIVGPVPISRDVFVDIYAEASRAQRT